MDTTYIANEYNAGKRLANTFNQSNQSVQVRIFKEVAKESDFCILGFADGLADE